ncbi:MAG: hypothetical protein ACRD0Y_09385, partial [Terriglobales bacterium]
GLSCLRWYLLLVIGCNLIPTAFLHEFGVRSHQYAYAYYACDLATTILGFLVLARLVELAFEKSSLKLPRLRLVTILLFTGVTVGSAAVVYLSRGSLSTGTFGAAMDQNFSFLGMVLAIVLFVGMNAMFVQGLRFRRVVLAFSIMYSADAIVYSIEAIAPGLLHTIGVYVIPAISVGTIALLAYSLWVPEKAPRVRPEKIRARLAQLEGRA